MWAIIGGSGFEKSENVQALDLLERETPFGQASSGLKRVRVGGVEAIFLPRHGSEHELLPSEVNYRANIFALRKHGATRVLAFSAVGSLRPELAPGMLAVPAQFIDRTKAQRQTSFFGAGVVGHVSLAHPVCAACSQFVAGVAKSVDVPCHIGGTSICIEGPYFSTQAESKVYRSFGADLIGMTSFPEYALVREAGMCYLPCFFVTDFDCWDDTIAHVTIQEVLDVMRKNNIKAYALAAQILKVTKIAPCQCATSGISAGLMTPKEHIPAAAREWLAVLEGGPVLS